MRGVRRWLCKWCGHYIGPDLEGTNVAGMVTAVDRQAGHWQFRDHLTPGELGLTPAAVMNVSPIAGTWPWRG